MEINHKIGIHFCGGDEKLHIENLRDFYMTSATFQDRLRTCGVTGHVNDYLIEVHALKGIARNIGAENLSDMAFEHETKSRQMDQHFILENVGYLLDKWNEVLMEIEELLGKKTLSKKVIFESNGIILSRDVIDLRISQIVDALCAFENDEAEKQLGDLLRYNLPEHVYHSLLTAYELVGDFEYQKAIEVLEQDS